VKLKVDFSKLAPETALPATDPEEKALLEAMVRHARAYIESFAWCGGTLECHLGDVTVPGLVAVCLLKIVPGRRKVDEWLWVIVGDLPPAYFPARDARTPAAALAIYTEEMQLWVDAVKAGRSTGDLIPIESSDGLKPLAPSTELANRLEARLRYLENEVLPRYR
jgi:hypothetical protein